MDAAVPAGVQACSREFLEVVKAASDTTVTFAVEWSRRRALRWRRKLHFGSYLDYDPASYSDELKRALAANNITHVFLNRAELLRFAPLVRNLAANVTVVVMSHGNQTGDDLYEVAGPGGRGSTLGSTWKLGLDLRTESYMRHRFVDAVCAMSEEEAVLERWLGTKRVFVIPRIVDFEFLDWNPVPGRAGFVGTLDHTPNRAALEQLLPLLDGAPDELEVELVGVPQTIGEKFQSRFRKVRYRGVLWGDKLTELAVGWSLFLNPIFWLPRGASMKLGGALGWGLPVLTTRSGRRGYRIPDTCVITCRDDPRVFAEEVVRLLQDAHRCRAVRESLLNSTAEFPTARSVGRQLRRELVGEARG